MAVQSLPELSGRHAGLSVLLLFLLLVPASAAFGQSQPAEGKLYMISEEGDWIGAGKSYNLISPAAKFSIQAQGSLSGSDEPTTVSIYVEDAENYFNLQFSTRSMGVPMSVGTFPDAQDYPFEESGHPGISVSGNHRGCSGNGKFKVTNFALGYGEKPCSSCPAPVKLAHFAADFEQTCEGSDAQLTGSVIVSDPTVVAADPDQDGGDGDGDGDGGDDGGGDDGTPPAPPPPPDVELIMTEGHLFEVGNSRSMTIPVRVTTREGWDSDVTLSAFSPRGISVSFEPSKLPAPGSGQAAMTISVDSMTLPVRHHVPFLVRSDTTLINDMIFVDVVCEPPIILDQEGFQPGSREVAAGETVTLAVNPTGGTEPYFFQWYEGSSRSTRRPIEGANESTFTPPPVNQTAWYWVRVSNACGSRDSWIATLTPTTSGEASTPTQRRRGVGRRSSGD